MQRVCLLTKTSLAMRLCQCRTRLNCLPLLEKSPDLLNPSLSLSTSVFFKAPENWGTPIFVRLASTHSQTAEDSGPKRNTCDSPSTSASPCEQSLNDSDLPSTDLHFTSESVPSESSEIPPPRLSHSENYHSQETADSFPMESVSFENELILSNDDTIRKELSDADDDPFVETDFESISVSKDFIGDYPGLPEPLEEPDATESDPIEAKPDPELAALEEAYDPGSEAIPPESPECDGSKVLRIFVDGCCKINFPLQRPSFRAVSVGMYSTDLIKFKIGDYCMEYPKDVTPTEKYAQVLAVRSALENLWKRRKSLFKKTIWYTIQIHTGNVEFVESFASLRQYLERKKEKKVRWWKGEMPDEKEEMKDIPYYKDMKQIVAFIKKLRKHGGHKVEIVAISEDSLGLREAKKLAEIPFLELKFEKEQQKLGRGLGLLPKLKPGEKPTVMKRWITQEPQPPPEELVPEEADDLDPGYEPEELKEEDELEQEMLDDDEFTMIPPTGTTKMMKNTKPKIKPEKKKKKKRKRMMKKKRRGSESDEESDDEESDDEDWDDDSWEEEYNQELAKIMERKPPVPLHVKRGVSAEFEEYLQEKAKYNKFQAEAAEEDREDRNMFGKKVEGPPTEHYMMDSIPRQRDGTPRPILNEWELSEKEKVDLIRKHIPKVRTKAQKKKEASLKKKAKEQFIHVKEDVKEKDKVILLKPQTDKYAPKDTDLSLYFEEQAKIEEKREKFYEAKRLRIKRRKVRKAKEEAKWLNIPYEPKKPAANKAKTSTKKKKKAEPAVTPEEGEIEEKPKKAVSVRRTRKEKVERKMEKYREKKKAEKEKEKASYEERHSAPIRAILPVDDPYSF